MALSKEAREYFAKEGRKGGKATAAKMSPEERSAKMKKAAEARWKKVDEGLERLDQRTKQIEEGAKRLKKAIKPKAHPTQP